MDRAIRVFVSSTFRDMHEERDRLVKFVFPVLRKLCESRGVTWGEVDLRWGITDEQAAEGRILPVCLEEIRRCRPYFLGLLGERYGFVPQDHAHSVTELEIVHGVLREPSMHARAFFYFRDPGYVARIPPDGPRTDFESESPHAAERVRALKQRIRDARDAGACRVRENYTDAGELGEWILDDFRALIDELFPDDQRPDPRDRERAEHDAYAESRRRIYVPRQAYFDRLDAHVRGAGPPLVILGESGAGKSALVANWVERHRLAHPADVLVTHFVGASAQSADWRAMLRRILVDFARGARITRDIPTDPEELRVAFGNWLHMAAGANRIVLIIDALNQLDDRDGALDLVWLPDIIPENVRVVLSTLPGRPLDALRTRGWPTLDVAPLDETERLTLIHAYLAQYTKALDRLRAERIAAAPQSANPLYLRALLEELRLFGSHERLDERVAHYLDAASVADLYQRILARWEADYGAGMQLTRTSMTLLWAARRGLSDAELLDLMGQGGLPLARAHWAPLSLAAEQALVSRAGLLGFGHEYLREAVARRYVPTPEARRAAHLRLADYFETLGLGRRVIDELPWQLAESQGWERLRDLLVDREFLSRAWDADKFDVQASWARMEASGSVRMVDAYRDAIETPGTEPDDRYLDAVALLLNSGGHAREARHVYAALADRYAAAGNSAALEVAFGGLGAAALALSDWDEAMKAFKRQEQLCRAVGDRDGLRRSLGGQGLVHFDRGELGAAMVLHKEVEAICREAGDVHGVAISLNNQALVAYTRRDFDAALALYREEERICRGLGDLDGLQHSLGGQADVIHATGHFDGVIDRYQAQERICRQLGDQRGLLKSLGNQAGVLKDLGNFNGAMALHRQEEELCRRTSYVKGLAVSLGNQALILDAQGKEEEALERLREQEHVCRAIDDRPGLAACLGNQAALVFRRGDLERALAYAEEREAIVRELGPPVQLGLALGAKAQVLRRLGRSAAVTAALKEQERLGRESGDPAWVVGSLLNQAMLLDDPEERRRALEEARRVGAEHGIREVRERIEAIEHELGA